MQQRPPDDTARSGQPRSNFATEHPLHFAGNSGHRHQLTRPCPAAAVLHPDSWSRAARVGDRTTADGQHRLDPVAIGHLAAAASKQVCDMSQAVFVECQLNTGQGRQGVTRDVVQSRTQAAGDQHQVATTRCNLEHLGHRLDRIRHRRVVRHHDPQLRQLQTQPLTVRVQLRPTRQLAPDRHNLRLHANSSSRVTATPPLPSSTTGSDSSPDVSITSL